MNQINVVSFPWGPPESRFRNVLKLVQRRLLSFYRDKSDLAVTLLQPPLLALAFFLIFQKLVTTGTVDYFQPLRSYLNPGPGPSTLIFLAVLTAIWFGISKAIIELPNSRVLYQQERLTFLRDFDYLSATFISLSLIVGLQVILFSLSFHLLFVSMPAWLHPFDTYLVETDMCQESLDWLFQWLHPFVIETTQKTPINLWTMLMPKLWIILTALLWLTAISAITLAMLVSVFVKTRAAVTMMTFVMIIQLLLGGSIVKPVKEMHSVVQISSSLMSSRWGLEGAIILFDQLLNFNLPKHEREVTTFSFAGSGDFGLRKYNALGFLATLRQVNPTEITDPWLANFWCQALIKTKGAKDPAVAIAFGNLPQPLSKEEQEYLGKIGTDCNNAEISPSFVNQPVPEGLMSEIRSQFKDSLEKAVEPIIQKVNQNGTLSSDEQKLWQTMQAIDPLLKLYRQEHTWIPWLRLAILATSFFLLTWLGFTLASKL